MKKFHFKLESIFKIRKETERQCEMEVQRVQALMQGVFSRMNQITQEQNHWRKSYNESVFSKEGNTNEAWLLLIEQYLLALEKEWTHQGVVLSTLEKDMEKAQQKLREAYKARRQVEHLKEKQKKDYLQKLNKMMEKETAEMTILRFSHQQRELMEGSAL